MFGKKIRFLGLIGASSAIPYFLANPQAFEKAKTQASQWISRVQPSSQPALGIADRTMVGSEPRSSWSRVFSGWSSSPTELPPPAPHVELVNLLRFDITPRMVIESWPRVTTVLAESNLEGLRTSIVTGVQMNDIAGSITYYFDKQHQLQRIGIHGFTGDEQKTVQVLTTNFGFRPEPTLGAGLYCTKWNGRPVNALRVSHAPVVRASSPNTRFEILLEINRPGSGSMSPEFRRVLEQDRQLARW